MAPLRSASKEHVPADGTRKLKNVPDGGTRALEHVPDGGTRALEHVPADGTCDFDSGSLLMGVG